MKPRGRFISDAVCPKCGAVDRIQMDVETGLRRWCIACDFDETLSDTASVNAESVQVNQEQVVFLKPLESGRETK